MYAPCIICQSAGATGRNWQLMEKRTPWEAAAWVFVQRCGFLQAAIQCLLLALQIHALLAEPVRVAQRVAGGIERGGAGTGPEARSPHRVGYLRSYVPTIRFMPMTCGSIFSSSSHSVKPLGRSVFSSNASTQKK